jgi:hypothetical protein
MGERIQNGLRQLLESRKSSEERMQLHHIKERLRRRLELAFKTKSPPPDEQKALVPPPSRNGHTEKFNRVMVLWLDLHRAMADVKQQSGESPAVPWNCQNERVNALWEQITRPENLPALMEWLYQSASGEMEIWTQQALQECQLRSEQTTPPP